MLPLYLLDAVDALENAAVARAYLAGPGDLDLVADREFLPGSDTVLFDLLARRARKIERYPLFYCDERLPLYLTGRRAADGHVVDVVGAKVPCDDDPGAMFAFRLPEVAHVIACGSGRPLADRIRVTSYLLRSASDFVRDCSFPDSVHSDLVGLLRYLAGTLRALIAEDPDYNADDHSSDRDSDAHPFTHESPTSQTGAIS